MQKFYVPCECGNGWKTFLQAGEHAQNPGRFYYRCPMKIKACSFIWADELLTNKYSRLHHLISPCHESFSYTQNSGYRTRSRNFQGESSGEMSGEVSSSEHVVAGVPRGPQAYNQSVLMNFILCWYGFSMTLICFLLAFVVVLLLKK